MIGWHEFIAPNLMIWIAPYLMIWIASYLLIMIVTLVTFFGRILLKLANGGCIQTKFISSFLKRLSSYLKLKASLFICVHAFWSWTYAFIALHGDGIESLLLPKITNAKNNFIVCV